MSKNLSKDKLARLYRQMLRIRLCEESFIEPILQSVIKCPVHLCTGQEAVAVGVCSALQKEDFIFGNHRSHGHYLAKGGNLNRMVAEVYCRSTGCAKGRGGSMHLRDVSVGMLGSAPIVAGTISLALGAALAIKIKRENKVVVSFFGDGAAGEGVLYEALNFAALKKLPIIFVCENNLYSTHMPIKDCRVSENIFEIAKPFSIKTWQVDGNNIFKVTEKAKNAVSLCRKGEGPVFLEFLTYRLHGHVGPDDNVQGMHTDIRPPEEIKCWLKKDPVLQLKNYLLNKKVISKPKLKVLEMGVDREIKRAHKFALASSFPEKSELNKYLYD
ncbi:MAG: thiamine pyrophosphate-dependent dehydrogenase E1 component subunit alpha [Candidatus Omnitrophica bacterium]|nr:thiamine pyrophosphate-dependent dehydrogenase E1 component subunit alpha [Candidatus Omnitrophota bacterium]MBU4468612.1 thiamine pyrophosphate-dependent dehydrogenase E1 component subunit alpha [Candidatus Omnitrophota bacterium]MCG2708257.1 thiamine pyrophosphate-dependent dehydrogenase E1 component subunit alpha [Candidatus Omnitrophota bacterium]